ncbi:MAG: AraC family transcriptional regulator [Alistipes sp.]|nr:AraC family transcriptional regulator [Alistipes sp.]
MNDLLSFANIDVTLFPNERISIGDDFFMVPYTTKMKLEKNRPIKLSPATITICTAGRCKLRINLREYEIVNPMLVTVMPGQIIETLDISPDFTAYSIAVSKRFIDMINLPGWQSTYLDIYNRPVTALNDEQLQGFRIFFNTLHRAASNTSNPFRLLVIENLIRAFYYGGSNTESCIEQPSLYKNNVVQRFMELAQEHHQRERLIGFYADKLCITPKYLSKLVKENTGRSAGEWIESYVILEARAMLQSPNMSIQQIAAALNFPNQSFFGKYFKRVTGISPKQYRLMKYTTSQ